MDRIIRTSGLVALLACAGCATVCTWDEAGRTKIRIDDARVVTTNGVASTVEIVGEKSVSVIPFVWSVSSFGVVDRIEMPTGAVKRMTASVDPAVTNGFCRVSVFDIRDVPTNVTVSTGCRAALISDSNGYRKYLAVATERGEQWAGVVLAEPRIDYMTDAYVREECGARTVVERIAFIPFAFSLDVVTLPIALCVGPFVHM